MMPAPMVPHDQKSNVACHFNYLDLQNAVVPLKCNWNHVMAIPVPMAIHDQKSHVALLINYLDLRNRMVPLTMVSTPCDAHVSANDVT